MTNADLAFGEASRLSILFDNPDGTPYFVGRQFEIEDIDESLVKTGMVEVVGEPGVGKTTLATKYAELRRDRYGSRILQHQGYSGAGLTAYVNSIAQSLRSLDGPGLIIIDTAELLDPGDALQAIKQVETGPWLVHFMIVSRIPLGLGTVVRLQPPSFRDFVQLMSRAVSDAYLSAEDIERLWTATDGSFRLAKTLIETWDRTRDRPIGSLGSLIEPFKLPGILGPDGRPLRRGSDSERTIVEGAQFVTSEMFRRLALRPELIHELGSREFEQFAAELFARQGYEVTLTPATSDGGKDLYLAERKGFASFRYAVECKKYHPTNTVSVNVVRSLAGVVDGERLNGGIVLTTSRFSRHAHNEAARLQWRMSLADFTALKSALEPFRGLNW